MSSRPAVESYQHFESLRAEATGEGPLLTRTRKIKQDGTGNAAACNLTQSGRDIVGLFPGEDALVEVYQDRIVIRPAPEGADE